MKCHDFAHFQKQEKASLYMIVSSDEEDRKRALHFLLKEELAPIFFFPDSFTKESFMEEVETQSFLVKKKTIVLEKIDELNKEFLNFLSEYLQKRALSHTWLQLILTAQKGPAKIASCVDEFGVLFVFPAQEKPWEKEKRVAEWLTHLANEKGVHISSATAQMFIQTVEAENLENELEKLICFVGKRGEITPKDIQLVSIKKDRDTFFQLADAIFERKSSQALKIGRSLLEEGNDPFLLLSQLRSQIETASHVLKAHEDGGKEAVSKAFPFLKGGFLDKKLRIFQNYGALRLKRGQFLLFEAELKAKTFKFGEIIFETLIARLSDDALSSP